MPRSYVEEQVAHKKVSINGFTEYFRLIPSICSHCGSSFSSSGLNEVRPVSNMPVSSMWHRLGAWHRLRIASSAVDAFRPLHRPVSVSGKLSFGKPQTAETIFQTESYQIAALAEHLEGYPKKRASASSLPAGLRQAIKKGGSLKNFCEKHKEKFKFEAGGKITLVGASTAHGASTAKTQCASKDIGSHEVVACSVEGDVRRAGRISLVCIATPRGEYVYDVLQDGAEAGEFFEKTGLKDVLESSAVVKIMCDCSSAADALFHLHGVKLCNVWDIKVGWELLNPHISRSSLPTTESSPRPADSRLVSLDKVLAIMRSERPQSEWEQRPLPQDILADTKRRVRSFLAAATQQSKAMATDLEPRMRERCEQAVEQLRVRDSVGTADLSPGQAVEYQIVNGQLELLEDYEAREALSFQEAVWERAEFISVLPERFRGQIACHPGLEAAIDFVMDLGRPAMFRHRDANGTIAACGLDGFVTMADLNEVCGNIGPFNTKSRAMVCGSLHRVSALRSTMGDVIGLTVRCGRHLPNSISPIEDLLGGSLLIIGPPGSGKTTLLRGGAAFVSQQLKKTVLIIDGSNEIAGEAWAPHPCVSDARRMMVPEGQSSQETAMIEALENHTPQVIIVDEISSRGQALAARTVRRRGVDLICTCHGGSLWDLTENNDLSVLVGGKTGMTLSHKDKKYDGVRKFVQERVHETLFDAIVEISSERQWVVHRQVSHAVDEILAGRHPVAEQRSLTSDGRMFITRVAA